jgi:membrane protein YdbS with pleckstrin-like domain
MSNRIEQSRSKKRRKRSPVGLKVRWRRVLVFVPLAVLMLAFFLGSYVLELYEHWDLWNAIVLVVVVTIVTMMAWPKLRSELCVKKKSRKSS